ncbi:MAG: hypothetical protein AAGD25_07390 [Cyanobacteria bacterium P01_F01_bin.150]
MLSSTRSPFFQLYVGDRISFNYYQRDQGGWILVWGGGSDRLLKNGLNGHIALPKNCTYRLCALASVL